MIDLIRLCQIIASYSSDGQTKLDGFFISLFDSRLQEGWRELYVNNLLNWKEGLSRDNSIARLSTL